MAKTGKPILGKSKTCEVAGAHVSFRLLVWSVVACAFLLGLGALLQTSERDGSIAHFAAQGWGAVSEVIVRNRIRALWHAAVMTAVVAGALWFLLLARRGKPALRVMVAWGLVLLVAGDAWLLTRQFIKTMPLSAVDENPVISLLKKDMPQHRVALVTQEGFYNWWLTYSFPYHGIQAVNSIQMPRMPDDYRNFLQAVGRNPIRYWQLASVSHVLAPVEVWLQIQKDSKLKDLFELVFSYNVAPAEAGVTVVPALLTGPAPARHAVLRFKQPAPRYALVGGWDQRDDQEVLRQLAAPEYRPFEKILIPPGVAGHLQPMSGEGLVGQVESLGYRSGYYHLRTMSERPSLLRVAEKYDPDWKAIVDGKPTEVLRADYLFQAVQVPAGTHTVILQYAPPAWPLYVQYSGMIFCLLATVVMFVRWLVFKRRGIA